MSSRTNRRYSQIGLDRLVRLKWLERTANLFLAGSDFGAVKAALQEDLKGNFRSKNTKVRGSIDKTITILMKIWVRPPQGLQILQEEGLKLLSRLPREDHIAVHWGMAMAVYPFWGAVAAHVGRLLRLQGTASVSQVQRRLREQYGERETVFRRVRYVLRSFVDWEVLKESPKKGIYTPGLSLQIRNLKLTAWLAEAFLYFQPQGSAPLSSFLGSMSLFPFRISPISPEKLARASRRLEVLRHGLDQDLVMLRKEKLQIRKPLK